MLKTYPKLVAAITMRFGYHLDHIHYSSLIIGDESLFRSLPGMFIAKFIFETPRADNIMTIDFAEFADLYLG